MRVQVPPLAAQSTPPYAQRRTSQVQPMSNEKYCIYTDSDVSEEAGNYDHIVPLSLGGDDGFTVWSDAQFNSDVGSKIDGALANDPLMMFARRDADARGHSNAEPVPKWKRSKLKGEPVQVSWGKNVEVWDSKANALMDPKDVEGQKFTSEFKLDISVRPKFVAKVVLGAGQHFFEDTFRHEFDCQALRDLLKADDIKKHQSSLKAHDIWLKGYWPFPDIAGMKVLTEFTGRTTVFFLINKAGIEFHVGVLGQYVGSIFVPGDGSKLREHNNEVMVLGPGKLALNTVPYLRAKALEFFKAQKEAAEQESKAN